MADKTQATTEVVEAIKEKEVVEKPKTDKAEEKPVENGAENGDKKATAENGDSKEEAKEEKVAEKETEKAEAKTEDKCTVKRKSTGGGDVTDSVAATEEASPEKKAKVAAAENATDAKPEAEVTA